MDSVSRLRDKANNENDLRTTQKPPDGIEAGESMVPIPNFKKPKDMTKTYTTEEIVRRLKAGESVTCITNDSLNFAKGNNYKYSHAIGDMIHFYVNSIPIGIDINKFTDYFMFLSDRNNINFSTKYTEKEILERLTNGETITAINPCTFVNSKVDQFNVGKTYIPYGDKGRFVFVEYFTVISNVDVNHKVFIKDLCDYFMFTSDYNAMKSEEDTTISKTETVDTPKEEPQIPEWLQRERAAHWSRCYASYQSTSEKSAEYADKDLEQFDKRFLNDNHGNKNIKKTNVSVSRFQSAYAQYWDLVKDIIDDEGWVYTQDAPHMLDTYFEANTGKSIEFQKSFCKSGDNPYWLTKGSRWRPSELSYSKTNETNDF